MTLDAPADQFADIRPYNDDEVREVLDRVIADDEFIAAVAHLQFAKLPSQFDFIIKRAIRLYFKWRTRNINTVWDFQMLVRPFVEQMIQRTTAGFSFSGIENLDPNKNYLFISNHRDIALDPALLNYALVKAGMGTLRIAIGDNLLTKPFASDLMRLNKSFIVNRTAKAPRQILQASKKLAQYIRHSVNEDRNSVWLAQREGRAKDGFDSTEPAIIKMLSLAKLNKQETLTELVKGMHIVPVAISYEYDPCDADKARELYLKATEGNYKKADQEDIASIAKGIAGEKGEVHIAVGAELSGEYATPEDVAKAIDGQILSLYQLHASNYYAHTQLSGSTSQTDALAEEQGWRGATAKTTKALFESRVNSVPEEHRESLLKMYAVCVQRKLDLGLMN